MVKKKRSSRNQRRKSAANQSAENDSADSVVDAVAELVHQGFGQLIDVVQLRAAVSGWRPHSSMNYEYVFAWNPAACDTQGDCQTAEERLDSGRDCQWVDLSFITDGQGREVFVIEMGDAVTGGDDDFASIIARMDEVWRWKTQPLTIVGPFASSDEAEAWMAENGAFKEAD